MAARTDFTLQNSTLITEEAPSQDSNFFFCNDLVEKRKYIYFKRGRFGTSNYQCGNERLRMRKKTLTWKQSGDNCTVNLPVWIVEF